MATQMFDKSGNVIKVPAWDAAYSVTSGTFSPAITTATTDCQLYVMAGAAGTVARIKRVRLAARLTTLAYTQLRLERWSTAGTLGSAVLTALTAVRHGSPTAPGTQPGAPALTVSSVGTAAYTTPGTVAGILAKRNVIAKSTTAVDAAPDVFELNYSNKGDNPIELCGTTDLLVVINYPLATATGAVFDFELQWEESQV